VLPNRDGLAALRQGFARLAFDFDDAIYAAPPELGASPALRLLKRARRLALRGSTAASSRRRPLQRVLGTVDLCVAGNAVLAAFARRHAKQVIEIPTTVEPVAQLPERRPQPPVLVWLGLPDNLQYLDLIRRPLERLSREHEFRLRIVSSATWSRAPTEVEFVQWTPAAAREALVASTAGLAPLTDDPWTRGKCAFRSIQYGGHGLPAVATPVGITDQVVLHGKTGFLARSEQEWVEALRALLTRPGLAHALGAAALAHVRSRYSDGVAVRAWREALGLL
jgi:hypothetical protein